MPKSKLTVIRRVRGTTLAFDPTGRPKVVHTDHGPREREEIRQRRAETILNNLKSNFQFFLGVFLPLIIARVLPSGT